MKKVTIIGAGIVGMATACYLRRDGHEVTVVTRDPPGEYCSFGNAGMLNDAGCVPQRRNMMYQPVETPPTDRFGKPLGQQKTVVSQVEA